jgi:hypothetical protein
VSYDRLEESVQLIESGPPTVPARLSRRRRFLPLAVDVDGDTAVTVFLRRGAGYAELEGHVLTRRRGTWVLHGGGGGGESYDELVRPRSVAELGGYGSRSAGGGVMVSEWPHRWLAWSWFDLVPEVAVLEVEGRRVTVPWHHHAAVIVHGERTVPVTLLDATGARLEVIPTG